MDDLSYCYIRIPRYRTAAAGRLQPTERSAYSADEDTTCGQHSMSTYEEGAATKTTPPRLEIPANFRRNRMVPDGF